MHDRLLERVSIRRRSISKQSGTRMSSRWIAPKPGAILITVSTNSSTSVVSIRIGIALIPAIWS